MEMLSLVAGSAVLLTVAYFTYGRLLGRLFQLDDRTATPAVTQRDDVDYVPCATAPLMSQHFSAIAAAGPIVGPILAGLAWGWLPAMVWILAGAILVGGVHDLGALVASIRHRASSIIDVVRVHISHRAWLLFLAFVWLALIYIVVAFTDITATMFVGALDLQTDTPYPSVAAAREAGASENLIQSGAVATSSLLYLLLPVVMGLIVRSGRMSMRTATIVFLPLVVAAIVIGPQIPLNLDEWIRAWWPEMPPADAARMAVRIWNAVLLVYCAIASLTPMWLLLQPRGQLGGWFLYTALAAGMLGILFGDVSIQHPRFVAWQNVDRGPLLPMLFITIACGACSGFHSLIASGTTSKQLTTESSARAIGYGTMLLEAMVAIVSLCCVMMIPAGSPLSKASPNFVYANGIGTFLSEFGLSRAVGVSFALMAFNTFVFDTLDVCTRLGRFILQELTGWKSAAGRWFGTLLTAGVPVFFVMQQSVGANGRPIPLWRVFWELFGASNQLLAALTLLGITVWLWRTRQQVWVLVVAGLPAAFMYTMSSWALMSIVRTRIGSPAGWDTVACISVVLLVLAVLMLLEGIAALLRRVDPPADAAIVPVGG